MTIAHFYCAALSFFFGVLYTSFVPLTISFLTLLSVVAALELLMVYYIPSEKVNRFFFWGSISLLFFAVGGIRVDQALYTLQQTTLHSQVGAVVTLEGVVQEESTKSDNATTLYVTLPDTILLVKTDRYSTVTYGDVVQVTGTITIPEDFETMFGRTFSYINYLQARGVVYTMPFAEVVVVRQGGGSAVVRQLLLYKEMFLKSIYAALPEPASGLAAGLLLGVKGALSEDLEVVFRQAGIIHIVVLSGYNVMLVVVFFMFLLKRFLQKRWRLWVGLVVITLFALLVGLSATVIRASIMAALLLVMETIGRTYYILRGLVVAAVAMLLVNPLLLAYDVGFQLSFLATLGLVVLAPWFERVLARVPNVLEVRNFLIATIATQIMVLPLLLYQMGEVSLVAIIVNVLVLPVVPIAMALTALVGLVGLWVPTVAAVIAYAAYATLMYIVSIATWFATIPFATLVVPVFPWWGMVGMYLVGAYGYLRVCIEKEKVVLEQKNIAGWTIVEEKNVILENKELIQKVESGKDSTVTLPIFFR